MKKTHLSVARIAATFIIGVGVLVPAGSELLAQCTSKDEKTTASVTELVEAVVDTSAIADLVQIVQVDSLPEVDAATRYSGLTDEDFLIVAKELGVEVAAIKAVVEIEAGPQMKGFWAPGVPIINFDPTMYHRFCSKAADKRGEKGAKVPSGLSGYPLKEWTQLVNARKSNAQGADLGTFWGMFQIGGFNYKTCGCSSIGEFVDLMSHSELEQLELFAAFITNAGMLPDLKNKNWAAFARKYNGTSYAKRGYHTRMASAYKKYKSKETSK